MRGCGGVVGAGPKLPRSGAGQAALVFLAHFPRYRAAECFPIRERGYSDLSILPVPGAEDARLRGMYALVDLLPVELQKNRIFKRKHQERRHQAVGKGDATGVERVGNPAKKIVADEICRAPAESCGSRPWTFFLTRSARAAAGRPIQPNWPGN